MLYMYICISIIEQYVPSVLNLNIVAQEYSI